MLISTSTHTKCVSFYDGSVILYLRRLSEFEILNVRVRSEYLLFKL